MVVGVGREWVVAIFVVGVSCVSGLKGLVVE